MLKCEKRFEEMRKELVKLAKVTGDYITFMRYGSVYFRGSEMEVKWDASSQMVSIVSDVARVHLMPEDVTSWRLESVHQSDQSMHQFIIDTHDGRLEVHFKELY